MSGRIFLSYKQRGRLGNQLFRINAALQLSRFFSTSVSLPRIKATELFDLGNLRKTPYDLSLRKNPLILETNHFSSADILCFLKLVKEAIHNNRDVVIPAELLGEGFFEFSIVHPSDLLKLKHWAVPQRYTNAVAIHYRGTDFKDWNKKALMRPEFYMESITRLDICDLNINIFSDEPNSPTVKHLLNALPNCRVVHTSASVDAFVAISKHRYVIASPSTFSFWAALLGRARAYVISSEWVDEMNNTHDIFWPRVAQNEKTFFQNVLLV